MDYFADRDVVLGILPLGTGNSFARTLGIPLSLDGAIEIITNGKVVDVDLGLVGSDYFANVATIGFSAEVVRRASRLLKRYLGIFAYGLAGVQALFAQRAFLCRMSVANQVEVFRTRQVIVLNGRFFGVRPLTPEAGADDRQLTVFTMADLNRWQMLKAWIGVLCGARGACSGTLPEDT